MSHSSRIECRPRSKSRRDLFPLKPESFHGHCQNLFLAEETKFHLNELAFTRILLVEIFPKEVIDEIVPLDIV
jgi:hypothetical protein